MVWIFSELRRAVEGKFSFLRPEIVLERLRANRQRLRQGDWS